MIGVFIDTFVVAHPQRPRHHLHPLHRGRPAPRLRRGCWRRTYSSKTNLAQTAFGAVFGESAGAMFVAVCLFFFAFSTILGWNLFGKINMAYLFGQMSPRYVYTVIALVFIFLGTLDLQRPGVGAERHVQ